MKRKSALIAVIFLLTGVLYAAPLQEGAAGGSGELVLLHTNDHHGAVLPSNGLGGLEEIASVVKGIKAVNTNVLLVDAGDLNTGSALSNMFNAEPDILAYNIMGYDAITFGNHEFDGTQEKLDKQISLAGFPFVSSNIKTQDGAFLGGNQYIVKNFGNVKVGVFGITTTHAEAIASPDPSLVFLNEIDAAREVVDILRNTEKVDIVIGLTHLGDVKETEENPTSLELAAAVEGINIIVDGHSHTFMEEPKKVNDTFVVSANEWGKYLGYGKLTVRNGQLVNFLWTPVTIGPDSEVIEMLEPYIEKADIALKEVIGTAQDTFILGNRLTRYQETALGNLICDANAWYLEAGGNPVDFVLQNGGNIRAELPKGPITQERILTILPFENYLFTASMTGENIIKLFDFIATIPQGAGGFPQFSSNVRVTIDKTQGAGVIRELTIGGEPIDPERVYSFCTNDYIMGGGDDYVIMETASVPFNVSLVLSYVVTEYIRAQGSVSPMTDGRMTVIGGVTP